MNIRKRFQPFRGFLRGESVRPGFAVIPYRANQRLPKYEKINSASLSTQLSAWS